MFFHSQCLPPDWLRQHYKEAKLASVSVFCPPNHFLPLQVTSALILWRIAFLEMTLSSYQILDCLSRGPLISRQYVNIKWNCHIIYRHRRKIILERAFLQPLSNNTESLLLSFFFFHSFVHNKILNTYYMNSICRN